MRDSYPEPWNLSVSFHAITRFKERIDPLKSEMWIANRLRLMVLEGHEYELKPEHRAKELLDHGFKSARVFRHGTGIFVFVSEGHITTVHTGSADRWRKKEVKQTPK